MQVEQVTGARERAPDRPQDNGGAETQAREPAVAPPARANPIIAAASLLAVLGVGGWLWVRLADTTAMRQALEQERAQQAAAARAAMTAAATAARVEGQVIQPTAATWTPTVRVEGTLGLLKEADVGFMASGRLQEIRAKLGDVVRKGQVLAALDTEQAQAQVRAAAAQVKAVEAQLALAQDGLTRTLPLVEKGAAPQSAGVQAQGQVMLAEAQLEAARSQVALGNVFLGNHVMESPINGVVVRAPTTAGTVVGPGIPLFRVVDHSQMRFQGTVTPEDALLLRVGSPVEIFVQNRILSGKVTAVLPTTDPMTRRVPLEAVAQNDVNNPVYAGTLVKAVVHSTAGLPVLRLPADALRLGAQDEVMVVEDGRLQPRRIVFSRDADGTLLVRTGLNATDHVLLKPPAEARAGDTVRVPEVAR
ncbi:MAG: efflux RND transporter periplasmic adaptor subunit [Deltaproteobacteria bacterium]|nr:efflux RND transporter periplasmic adaptor subunit [Deltaproteobacteria bacterium]